MTDDDFRGALTTLADRMPVSDITQAALDAGCRRKLRNRSTLAAIGTPVAVAAVVLPVSLIGGGSPPKPIHADHVTSPVDPEFNVGLPAAGTFVPVSLNRPKCTATAVHARAHLEAIHAGVIGTVDLNGNNCSFAGAEVTGLQADSDGPAGLIRLVANPNRTEPAAGLPGVGNDSQVALGFSWYGSWCGSRTISVLVHVPGTAGSMAIPASGPAPGCHGRSRPQVIAGTIDEAGRPVQGAPPDWRFLTATFGFIGPRTHGELMSPVVTFTNHSSRTIYLSPDPSYLIGAFDQRGEGTAGVTQGVLPAGVMRVGIGPSGGAYTIGLPNVDLTQVERDFRGKTITVTFSIAGVKPASVTVPISGFKFS